MDRNLVQELDTTLNEATVVELVGEADAVALVLDVLDLPEGGDPRRVLVFTGVARVRVLLREDDGSVLPLDGFDAVNRYLDRGQLHGWEFFDLPGFTADRPERVSLDRSWGRTGQHTFYWFNDVIEGTVEFDGSRCGTGTAHPSPLSGSRATGCAGGRRRRASGRRRTARSSCPGGGAAIVGAVDFPGFLDEVERQSAALRAAAVSAGPDAPVPSCPGWTTHRLVAHIARVHTWVIGALDAEPGAAPPEAERPPEDWDTLLTWWDGQVGTLVGTLRKLGPDAPVWTFDGSDTTTFWARRQAHETAIHRLDAEHAAGDVPPLIFDPEFAADGVDEALKMVTRKLTAEPADVEGTVLFHAADAGRAWLVTLTPGRPPEIGPALEPAIDTDASVVGTADAVYRAAWHRPSTAIRNGDAELIAALRTP